MGRKKYSKELKGRIALDAIKGQKTIAELATEYGVHANQNSMWKKQLLDAAPAAFSSGKDKDAEKKEQSVIICIKRLAERLDKMNPAIEPLVECEAHTSPG